MGWCVSTPGCARCQARSTRRLQMLERRTSRCGLAPIREGMDDYRPLLDSPTAITRRAYAAKALRSRTRGRLYSCDALLERLPQDLEHMTAKLGQFIQEEDAVVSQRHVA